MSEACRYLHTILSEWPRFKVGFNVAAIPTNGLYFLFENGETGHHSNRIVRIGTHRGANNLAKRIGEHLFTANKDRSIFRKHVGRCLLSRGKNPFLTEWEIDLTTKAAREEHGGHIDMDKLRRAEEAVSKYMNGNFSFVVLEVKKRADRLAIEESCIATISTCSECGPSKNWLGLHHSNPTIKGRGLWNVQGHKGALLDKSDVERIFGV